MSKRTISSDAIDVPETQCFLSLQKRSLAGKLVLKAWEESNTQNRSVQHVAFSEFNHRPLHCDNFFPRIY